VHDTAIRTPRYSPVLPSIVEQRDEAPTSGGFLRVARHSGALLPITDPALRAAGGAAIHALLGETVVVPAGSLLMGSPQAEPGRTPDESPLHEVAIREFELGTYLVTRQ